MTKGASGVPHGGLSGGHLKATLAFCCGTAFLLFGYDQGVLGAVISAPSFRKTFNDPSPDLEGWITSVYDLGCAAGSVLSFFTSDRLGRKGSLMWGCIVMVIGTILQTASMEPIQMIISRIITGVGNGMNTCAVPMWQAESFPAHNRGALLVIQSALIALGFPVSTFMGLASKQAEPSSFGWRWPVAFQGVFLIGILCTLPFLPESPRWLIQHHRVEEATEVFARLEGKGATIHDARVIRLRDDVVSIVEEERRVGEATWGEVFTEGKNRNLSRVLLGAGPYMMNQLSGINALAYYLPVTFERNIHFSKELSLIMAGVLGVQYTFVSILPYFFIEKVGRRKVLMGSAAACSVCMAILTGMLKVNTTTSAWVFFAFCCVFFDVFSLGILPVSWMYASEIMPLRTRNKGVACGVFTHWILNWMAVYITPAQIENLYYKYYIIWAVLNASFVPVTYFFYPETARRSLEDVDQIFFNEKFGITHYRSPGNRKPGGVDSETETESGLGHGHEEEAKVG